jgi:hypothetical protein
LVFGFLLGRMANVHLTPQWHMEMFVEMHQWRLVVAILLENECRQKCVSSANGKVGRKVDKRAVAVVTEVEVGEEERERFGERMERRRSLCPQSHSGGVGWG